MFKLIAVPCGSFLVLKLLCLPWGADLRREVQGHLPRNLRGRIPRAVRGARHHLHAPPHRRHGRAVPQVGRLVARRGREGGREGGGGETCRCCCADLTLTFPGRQQPRSTPRLCGSDYYYYYYWWSAEQTCGEFAMTDHPSSNFLIIYAKCVYQRRADLTVLRTWYALTAWVDSVCIVCLSYPVRWYGHCIVYSPYCSTM